MSPSTSEHHGRSLDGERRAFLDMVLGSSLKRECRSKIVLELHVMAILPEAKLFTDLHEATASMELCSTAFCVSYLTVSVLTYTLGIC